MGSRGWLFSALGLTTLALACEGRHDELARREGTGGKTGQGGAPSLGGFPVVAAGGKAVAGVGGKLPDEPPGQTVLTFVHGLVDAERVVVCFGLKSEAQARLVGAPEPVGGLAYATSFVARPIDGIDYTKDALEPVVIAGEIEVLAGLDCEEAVRVARAEQVAAEASSFGGRGGTGGLPPSGGGAGGVAGEAPVLGGAAGQGGAASETSQPSGGAFSAASSEAFAALGEAGAAGAGVGPLPSPPRLRVAELPTIPAGTLTGGRSYLYVGTGCLGGPAYSSKLERSACGEAYTPRLTTASAVLVAMSRKISFGKLGLQAVHGSLSTGPVEVTSAPTGTDPDNPLRYIAAALELGAIQPREPRLDFSAEESGANKASWRLEATQHNVRLFAEPWTEISTRAGLASLEDAKSYALVLVGPSVDLRATGFWNPPAFALVETDPSASMAQ